MARVTNDNDGDITCIGGNFCPELSYDERGHLQQWAPTAYTKDYYYDAFGRRYETASVGSVNNHPKVPPLLSFETPRHGFNLGF